MFQLVLSLSNLHDLKLPKVALEPIFEPGIQIFFFLFPYALFQGYVKLYIYS